MSKAFGAPAASALLRDKELKLEGFEGLRQIVVLARNLRQMRASAALKMVLRCWCVCSQSRLLLKKDVEKLRGQRAMRLLARVCVQLQQYAETAQRLGRAKVGLKTRWAEKALIPAFMTWLANARQLLRMRASFDGILKYVQDKTGACMEGRRRVAALLRRRFSHQLSTFLELWTHVHEYKKRRMKTHAVQEARVCSKVKRASLWWVLTHWSLHTSQV
jgi:hypothetical protein